MLRKLIVLVALLVPAAVSAETGYDAWLRYVALDAATLARYRELPSIAVVLGTAPPIRSAQQELARGLKGLLARDLRIAAAIPAEGAIVIGTLADIQKAAPQFALSATLGADGYWLKTVTVSSRRYTVVAGKDERGVLYGTFALLRKISTGDYVATLDERSTPYVPVRWVNQWDNLNGTIERGYGGLSIFWEAGHVRADLSRVRDYGRLLASLGINGISINNVNANPLVLDTPMVPEVARIADALRPWGVRVALAIDFGSPQSVGKLETYDPLELTVTAWWKKKADELYAAIPDFAGFVLKADSEGRVGPSTYGRTHADAANVVARALKPHGGLIFYRGFVYDHHMDWQNPKNDRARAAHDNFKPLDGEFDDNVIIQIKNGPIDFQVREPASPLFGALEKTAEAIELQVTQEYFGQARHTVFLVPMWKETLDFDMRVKDAATPVKAIVAGKVFSRPGGFVGVVNLGLNENWFGNHLSQANLYGYGRLAWNPDLTSRQIVDEWTRQTFSGNQKVVDTIAQIQLSSWRTFENYTGPLGLQTLTDIVGNHYGVAVEASERNGWGQWHKADDKGVGFDRSLETGTGFSKQFQPAVAKTFEIPASTPDDLVLFFHHVPYTYKLRNGKTVIQYLYDSHYEGAEAVERYVRDWRTVKGLIDDQRYNDVLTQLAYQAGQAIVWRDAVAMWFFKASGVADAKGRVGNYPGRMEAESATLIGYAVKPVTPWEAASGGKAIECATGTCTAVFKFDGAAGRHDLTVRYFDINAGASTFKVFAAGRLVGEWTADDRVLVRNDRVDSSSSSRRVFAGVALQTGDEIRIEGTADVRTPPAGARGPAGETAALDYIEIRPAGR